MRAILSWLLTPLFLLLEVTTLIIWHPIIVLSAIFGIRAQKWIVETGNFILLSYLKVLGGGFDVSWAEDAPLTGPVIIVSNHQSYFDIPVCIWVFRRYRAVFVAKRSLGRWLPSISYVLRNCGSALINRKSARQALPAITKLGQYLLDHHCAACIFPEGTRSRDGHMMPFRPHGLIALLKAAPSVPVLPVAIDGTWQLMRHNLLPIPLGPRIHIKIFSPLERALGTDEELVARCEETLRDYFAGADLTPLRNPAKK